MSDLSNSFSNLPEASILALDGEGDFFSL